jgi:phospholipid/cholesterol/gamma-HCH transport system substrate-binding protein
METRANFVMIGLFTVLSVVAAAIFVVWVANTGFDRNYAQYDVVFDGPVRGLEVGGEVRFNGIQVGDVVALNLDRSDPQDVVARIRVASDTPVKVDSVAQLEPAGLTGLAYIQILAGSDQAQRLRPPPGRARATIASRKGQLDRIFQGGEGVLETTLETLARVNTLLDDDNIQSISRSIANIESATGQLAQTQNLGRTLMSVRGASDEIAGLSRNVNSMAVTYDQLGRNLIAQTMDLTGKSSSLLTASEALVVGLTEDVNSVAGGAELLVARTSDTLTSAQKSLTEFDKTARALRVVGEDVSALSRQVGGATTNIDRFFALGVEQTLPDISRAALETRNTAMTFDQLAQRVDQGPTSFLVRPPDATVEWKR